MGRFLKTVGIVSYQRSGRSRQLKQSDDLIERSNAFFTIIPEERRTSKYSLEVAIAILSSPVSIYHKASWPQLLDAAQQGAWILTLL